MRHIHTPLESFDEHDLSLEMRCPRCHIRGLLRYRAPWQDATHDVWLELIRQTSCLWCDLLHQARDEAAGARPEALDGRTVHPMGA
jgi:hypothetical protein